MAGTRPFLGTEISLDEIDYTVSTESITSDREFGMDRPFLISNPKWAVWRDSKAQKVVKMDNSSLNGLDQIKFLKNE